MQPKQKQLIRAEKIYKSFGSLQVLKGIDLNIKKGEIVSVVGASGAGKSTLLHILGTLDKPDSGSIQFDNVRVDSMNDNQLSKFRNHQIGFVFQFHHLLPEFTALENVSMPAYLAGKSRSEAGKKARKMLDYLNLSERMDHKPAELSGGEQQRVAVARALINDPVVVLADEPSGNLDSASAKDLHELFFRLREAFNQTFVIVTHNIELADMADRKLVITDGVIHHNGI